MTNDAKRVELAVSAGGSAEPALDYVAAAFEKETGHRIKITYRHDLEVCDVVVLAEEVIERSFRHNGRAEPGGVSVGRNGGIGVAVRLGAKVPDVSSAQAFLASLLDVDRILLTQHSSSRYIEEMFRQRGIYDRVKAKIEVTTIGQLLVERLLSGEGNEIMLLPINRIRASADPRLMLVGPLPDELQKCSEFLAMPLSASAHKEVAWEFARFCGGPGKPYFLANGFD